MEKEWRFALGLLIVSLCLNIILFANVSIPSFLNAEITAQAVRDVDTNFDLYTKAVCDGKDAVTECYDALFVQCNGLETRVAHIVGETVEFDIDWEDPRE